MTFFSSYLIFINNSSTSNVGDLQKKKRRLDEQESELAPSTVHNIYKAFASIMNVAVQWNLIEESPCKNAKT